MPFSQLLQPPIKAGVMVYGFFTRFRVKRVSPSQLHGIANVTQQDSWPIRVSVTESWRGPGLSQRRSSLSCRYVYLVRRTYHQLTQCAGATSLASFAEDGGQTGLLISADSGLYVISADDATDGTVPATLIAQDKFFQSSATLTVAQDGEMISVWADGKSGVLGYISGKVAGIGNRPASKPGIPVMPAGSSTRFSASISQASNTASSSTKFVISDDWCRAANSEQALSNKASFPLALRGS